jgi:DNA-binding NtrC family response regulator
LLAANFARVASERYALPARALAPAALRRLIDYEWPGNVRELRNVIERATILAEGEELTARDLPEELHDGQVKTVEEAAPQMTADVPGGLVVPFTADFREDRREFERRYIARCLEESGGNVTRAAAILGMHRQSLQHKLRELGLARRYVSVSGDAQDKSDN